MPLDRLIGVVRAARRIATDIAEAGGDKPLIEANQGQSAACSYSGSRMSRPRFISSVSSDFSASKLAVAASGRTEITTS